MKEYRYQNRRFLFGLFFSLVLAVLSVRSLVSGKEPLLAWFLPLGILYLYVCVEALTFRIKITEKALGISSGLIRAAIVLPWSNISRLKAEGVSHSKKIEFRGIGKEKITVDTTLLEFDEFWDFAKSQLPAPVEIPALLKSEQNQRT